MAPFGRDSGRALRSDARRNRDRVLDAARAVFAERGMDAQMDDVAARAGVGVGTLYRHFPTKTVLLDELVAAKFEDAATVAKHALEEPDPWIGFVELVRHSAELIARDLALQEALRGQVLSPRAEPHQRALMETGAVLIQRAQLTGRLRTDFSVEDVPTLLSALAGIMSAGGGNHWRRWLDFFLDGLAPPSGV